MVLNAAVQMLREADELKQKILKFKSGTSMLQEHSLWATQQQLQKVYQKVLVLDLDYALDKKVEQDLWNVGFKQQIEALQAISKDRKNPLRSEAQAMLSWVLQAAAGFYLCLLHQICTTFKLDLPFRRRASLLGWVEGWGAGGGAGGAGACAPHAARYICQHCLVHLGDLARYRHQLRVAHTFYRHALVVSAHSGQPYNQLALVSWRRGRRLGALYWHVRSLLVRAPFPPAPANLARTLQAAGSRDSKDLPVLPGIDTEAAPAPAPLTSRLDAHAHVTELMRALHYIHTVQHLDTATQLVKTLNSSLTALVATDAFESMTLIKMAVVIIWAVQSSTEGLEDTGALTPDEARAAALAEALWAGALLALLLPAYTLPAPPPRALPPLKVWLQWTVCRRRCGSAWAARPQLWPALAHTLTALAAPAHHANKYDTVPLPEDEELHGFLPLEEALKGLHFANHATWANYGGALPDDVNNADVTSPGDMTATCLANEPELENKVRAYRIVELGKRISEMHPEHLTYVEEDGVVRFTAPAGGVEQLTAAIAELSAVSLTSAAGEDDEGDSEDEPPPPVIISEADFREKVREKRVGILKPQGSLERAREERAMAGARDPPPDEATEEGKAEERREARKARVNIAMAAIMRKQEETNKQVKFVTPPPTPESTSDQTEIKEQDKPKVIQPKPMKSLANLPIGRKTGGILSLKDKSGYPHLVNAAAEENKEKDDKKERETLKQQNQSTQSYQQKRQDQPNWSNNPANQFNDPRMTFQKHYGIQNTQLNYTFQPQGANVNVNNQGIRLPVVNPKEIDVRTAALQKQNSRQEMFQDGHKFNHNYQISGDKKNFLNDLPPRFANQYRYWQSAQENQFNDNKFRDDSFKANNSLFNNQQQRPSWMNPPENFQLQNNWWKPENPTNFNTNFSIPPPPINIQPNFYTPPLTTNPYQNLPSFNQMPNQNMGQKDSILGSNYVQHPIGQHQITTLPNLVSSQNFNSPLNSFGTYAPPVGYDSSMYPQFNNKLGYDPLQMKMLDKPPGYQGNKDLLDMGGLSFGSNAMDMQQRNLGMNFNDPLSGDVKSSDQTGQAEGGVRGGRGAGEAGAAGGSTYSLFSGSDTAAWGAAPPPPPHPHPHQSLWSGPGPSPLERLLEQQKQMKPPQ